MFQQAEATWITVDVRESLVEQGVDQFEKMTGRRAPRKTMMLEVLQAFAGRVGKDTQKSMQARLQVISET